MRNVVESQEGLKPRPVEEPGLLRRGRVEFQEGLKLIRKPLHRAVPVISRVESQEGLKHYFAVSSYCNAAEIEVESQEGLKLSWLASGAPPLSCRRISRRVETVDTRRHDGYLRRSRVESQEGLKRGVWLCFCICKEVWGRRTLLDKYIFIIVSLLIFFYT